MYVGVRRAVCVCDAQYVCVCAETHSSVLTCGDVLLYSSAVPVLECCSCTRVLFLYSSAVPVPPPVPTSLPLRTSFPTRVSHLSSSLPLPVSRLPPPAAPSPSSRYFSDPALVGVLYPSLIAMCFGNNENTSVVKEELSVKHLSRFIRRIQDDKKKELGKDGKDGKDGMAEYEAGSPTKDGDGGLKPPPASVVVVDGGETATGAGAAQGTQQGGAQQGGAQQGGAQQGGAQQGGTQGTQGTQISNCWSLEYRFPEELWVEAVEFFEA